VFIKWYVGDTFDDRMISDEKPTLGRVPHIAWDRFWKQLGKSWNLPQEIGGGCKLFSEMGCGPLLLQLPGSRGLRRILL